MPAPIGYSLWLWLKDNPAAQWALGIGAALIALLTWDRLRTNRIRREAIRKANDRAEKQSKELLKEIDNEASERTEWKRRTAERVSSADHGARRSDSLPSDVRSVLISDD
jgi:hypothetical protein